MASFRVKRNDTYLPLNANMDVTGAAIKMMARPRTGGPTVPLTCTPTDTAADGDFNAPTGTLAAGKYQFEVEVVVGGVTVTFPPTGYHDLTVEEDLG